MDKHFLSQEEINKLILLAQNGDIDARNKVIENNYRLVASITKTFTTNPTISYEDMYNEGIIGLIKAVDKFDTSKNFKFSTYATWWIKQAIQRSIADNNRTIRLPIHIQEQLSRLKKAQKYLTQELGREPNIDEIYDRINIDMSYYDKIVNHEFFSNLVDACKTNSQDEITEIEAIILEDLNFEEDAELICKYITTNIKRNKTIPSYNTINLKLNISKKKIAEVLGYDTNISSLDIPANDDMDTDIISNIPSSETVEDAYNKKVLKEGLIKAIDEVYGNEFQSKLLEKQQKLKNELIAFNKLNNEINTLKEEINVLKMSEENNKTLQEKQSSLNKMIHRLESERQKIRKTEEEIEKLNQKQSKMIDKAELIKRRYGIGGYKKETLQELGDRFNISRERIRQIEKQIIGSPDDNNSKSSLLRKKIMMYCNLNIDDLK